MHAFLTGRLEPWQTDLCYMYMVRCGKPDSNCDRSECNLDATLVTDRARPLVILQSQLRSVTVFDTDMTD